VSTAHVPEIESHDPYRLREDGLHVPPVAVVHREDEYDSRGFTLLRRMQEHHFWYRGRHRFLLHAVRRHLRRPEAPRPPLQLVDLGGGVGGWLTYLHHCGRLNASELALADSSEAALLAAVLPSGASRYQIDLLDLRWSRRWNVAFLLDVLEHIPDHEAALHQIAEALAPGGLLFVTVPALRRFWTWNDETARHQRRYSRADFAELAPAAGLRLLEARYFMFFLSPLLLASRLCGPRPTGQMTEDEKWALVERTHRVPAAPMNTLLGAVFACETPLGHLVPFPWGTSLLAVLRKPS